MGLALISVDFKEISCSYSPYFPVVFALVFMSFIFRSVYEIFIISTL